MNDFQNSPEPSTTPPESNGRKPQFSIGKMLLWTAVIAGGLTVVKVSDTNRILYPFPQVLYLCLYIVVVCGILSFFRDPKSFDIWFPTGMNVSIPAVMGLMALDPSAGELSGLLAIGALPYGIFLLVLNVRRIKRRVFFGLLWFITWVPGSGGPACGLLCSSAHLEPLLERVHFISRLATTLARFEKLALFSPDVAGRKDA